MHDLWQFYLHRSELSPSIGIHTSLIIRLSPLPIILRSSNPTGYTVTYTSLEFIQAGTTFNFLIRFYTYM